MSKKNRLIADTGYFLINMRFDILTLFPETTVERLLLQLKPHVHAKGTDYTRETVPERETVLSYGGEIAIVGDPKHHSSTNIIEVISSSELKHKA